MELLFHALPHLLAGSFGRHRGLVKAHRHPRLQRQPRRFRRSRPVRSAHPRRHRRRLRARPLSRRLRARRPLRRRSRESILTPPRQKGGCSRSRPFFALNFAPGCPRTRPCELRATYPSPFGGALELPLPRAALSRILCPATPSFRAMRDPRCLPLRVGSPLRLRRVAIARSEIEPLHRPVRSPPARRLPQPPDQQPCLLARLPCQPARPAAAPWPFLRPEHVLELGSAKRATLLPPEHEPSSSLAAALRRPRRCCRRNRPIVRQLHASAAPLPSFTLGVHHTHPAPQGLVGLSGV